MRWHRFMGSMVITCITLVGVVGLRSEENKNKSAQDNIVAIVNGKQIPYSRIKIDRKFYSSHIELLEQEQGRKIKPEEVEQVLLEKEKEILLQVIKQIIWEEQIKRFGLDVSDEELKQAFNKSFQNFDFSKETEKGRQYLLKIIETLEEIDKHPEASEEIYKRNLASDIDRMSWEIIREQYRTPEKRDILKRAAYRSVEEIKQRSLETMRPLILRNKLWDIVTKNVFVTEEEIQTEYRRRYGEKSKTDYKDVRASLKKKLLAQKKEQKILTWWQEQYKKAKIEIKDERFKDVLEILIPSNK